MYNIKILFLPTLCFLLSGCSFIHKNPTRYMQELINSYSYSYQDSPYPKDAIEIDEPIALKVIGQVPLWLEGKLFRNSPGKFAIGNSQLTHWFDGFAFISAFEFKKGKIYYQGAFLTSDQYLDSIESNSIKLIGFAKNFGESEPKHISRDGQKVTTANANINIEKIGDHLIALGETPLPIEIDATNLQTIGIFDYDDKLKKAKMWESAHMKRDPEDGTLYNFYTHYKMKSAYVIYKIEEGQTTRKQLVRYHINEPSYMHDFSITKNYIILTAYPLVVSPMDLLSLYNKNSKFTFIGAHRWEPELGTKIYVFNKKSGELVQKLNTEAKFAFHHINSFEDKNGKINLYLSSFDSAKDALKVGDHKEKNANLQLEKMVIDLKHSLVTKIILSKNKYELPRITEDLLGKENQYFYAVWYNAPSVKKTLGLVKYDLKTNQTKNWVKTGLMPGEPLFVAHPQAKTEDDGVILTVVYDEVNNRSFLLILDAKSMKELARAYTIYPLPIGLHSKFI